MGANVLVAGMMRNMGGLKESQAAFRKHWDQTGDALLNIGGIGTVDGQPADKDDPRMPYVKQEWPKMIFHPEKGEQIVENEAEMREYFEKGYRSEPYIKVQIALGDPKAEKVALQKELKEKDGQIAMLGDTLNKALARLEALEAKKK